MSLLPSRHTRVALTALIGGLLLAGCTGTEVLPPDPPIAEPGYPQYTPPATPAPSATMDPAVPDFVLSPPPPAATPPASPPDPEAAPEPSPSTPAPEPSPTPTPTPTPSPTPEPTPSATPTPLTLQTVEWSATCGGGADLVSPNPEITLTLPDLGSTRSGSGFSVLGWLSSQTETVPVSFATEVVVLRDGVVVAQHPGPGDSSPLVGLVPGTPLEVPIEHDLLTECSPPPTPTATLGAPRTPSASPSADATSSPTSAESSAATVTSPDGSPTGPAGPLTTEPTPPADQQTPPTDQPSPDSTEVSPDAALPLPPGSYTVVVVVRIADGPGAPGVVASASAPLMITS